MVLQRVKDWIADKGLRMTHAATLARFEQQLYDHKDNTMTPVEAFNLGLLSPQALLSPLLATQVSSFTNTDVLTLWNEASLEFQNKHGSAHPGAAPLNNLLLTAAYRGDTRILKWLHALKDPCQPLRWDAKTLLVHDMKTAYWAMWHKELLETDDPHGIVRKSLEAGNFISRGWMDHMDKPKTSYEDARHNMRDLQTHVHNLMHMYFPDMPWQERWSTFAGPLAPVSAHAPTFHRDGIQGRLAGEVHIAGLLYNAPLEIQQCLAAFKRSYYKEDASLYRDPAPKAIRHAFFGDPAPLAGVDPALAAWLSIMQGTPAREAADAWIAWQGQGQHLPPPMDVALPLDVLESSVP